MLPVDFKERNKIYHKPETWTDEQCGDLYVYQGVDSEGHPFCISAWQPSKEDIEAINAGRPVILQVCVPVEVPVQLWTVNENGEIN